MADVTFWHGGGRIAGDLIVPGDVAGTTRAAGDGVYVTTERSLAETYASTVDGTAWVYEVEPLGPLEETPPLIGVGPTISFRCPRARIIRRYTVSNARRAQLRAAVAKADRALGGGE
jgi:hypothetical protein